VQGVDLELEELLVPEAVHLPLLAAWEKAHFASVDTGLCGDKGRQNLAVLYHR
jgi:hypothetical protein